MAVCEDAVSFVKHQEVYKLPCSLEYSAQGGKPLIPSWPNESPEKYSMFTHRLLSSCSGAVIHLHFACWFHLVQTSGGFVLPDAVSDQSHFLLPQRLFETDCLSAPIRINHSNDFCGCLSCLRRCTVCYGHHSLGKGTDDFCACQLIGVESHHLTLQRQAQIRMPKGRTRLCPTRAQLAFPNRLKLAFRKHPLTPEPQQILL